jgi:hypothetical protein
MPNPMMILKISGIKPKKDNDIKGCICELISKAFTTRNLLHFAHWNTKSFASHMALGDLYDQIIEDIDEIVETYQGKFGLIEDLYCEAAKLPKDIASHVKEEAKWVEDNRMFISKGDTSIENLIDTLLGHYNRTVYKLENLH